MRVPFTSREEIAPYVGDIIDHLNKILIVISKNPSNPQFNHYTFEAIGALVRLDIHRLFVKLSVLPYLSLIFVSSPLPCYQVLLRQFTRDIKPYRRRTLSLISNHFTARCNWYVDIHTRIACSVLFVLLVLTL